MKNIFLMHIAIAALFAVAFISTTVQAEDQVVPVYRAPKSLRLAGESKRDMLARILQLDNKEQLVPQQKSRVRLHKNLSKLAEAKKKQSTSAPEVCGCCSSRKKCKNFKNFIGYWLLDCMSYLDGVTAIEFFEDECGVPYGRYFDGTQNFIRERNSNDDFSEGNFPSTVGDTFKVEILGPRSLKFQTFSPSFGEDDRRVTFRIQDDNTNNAYGVLSGSDSPQITVPETVEPTRYIRVPERPTIQYNSVPSKIDWTNPVEMFNYFVDYNAQLGQAQKAFILQQTDFIGWQNYEQLRQTMLTTGVTRTAKVSTVYRGDGYIGVWRTQFPEDLPITTIHTQEVHNFTIGSAIEISGFTGAYAVLNGTHIASAYGRYSRTASTPFPWQDQSSREPFVYINFDSSGIEEAYDPSLHGVATLTSHHGPITPATEYREFIAALLDFGYTSFGPSTHSAIYVWRDTGITIPETFAELKEGLAQDAVAQTGFGYRTSWSNGFELYWNPFILGGFRSFNVNDPFGLGFSQLDPYFNYDITLANYLNKESVKNVFFTITGPVLPTEPVTELLSDVGYTSNGSRAVFTINDFQKFPAPLVDEFGTHPYMIFGGADNSPRRIANASFAFFGGIVRADLTGDKTVAYLRFQDERAFDAPFNTASSYPLVFGRDDISDKALSFYIDAWAPLMEHLQSFNPDRYIIDIRCNNGGLLINQAIASFFGEERICANNGAEAYPGNGQRAPVPYPGSGIQTVYDCVPKKPNSTLNDTVARLYPKSIVRPEQTVEVIILTATRAASSGDIFPHQFLGADPAGKVQDLGFNVKARIIGDIDGRLWAASKGVDAIPLDTLSPNLITQEGNPVTAIYMSIEGGSLITDRHGYIVNTTLATRPNPLLRGWYDQTEWQDIGKTEILTPYPLGTLKPLPIFEDRSTWRDVWLENAIVN